MRLLPRSFMLPIVIACFGIAVLAPPALAQQGPSHPATKAKVACKKLHAKHLRCTMTIKRGAGINGTVKMFVRRGKLLVARGHGRVKRGKATLTMRLLHRMPPGRYNVTMVVTLHSKKVLRLR